MHAEQSETVTGPSRRSRAGRVLLRLTGWLALTLLVLVAITVATARHVADNLDQHRPQIEAAISDWLQHPVTIGRLDAEWQGPSLSLRATRITVGGGKVAEEAETPALPRIEPLSLGQLRLRLDGFRSLWRGGLVFDRIEADSLDLNLARDAQGQLTVAALTPTGEPAPDEPLTPLEPEPLAGWLPPQWQDPGYWLDLLAERVAEPRLTITRVTLGIESPEDGVFFIDIPQVDVAVEAGGIRASGRAMQSGTSEQLAAFTLAGDGLLEGRFTGRLYTNLRPGRLIEALSRELTWRHLELTSGEAEVKAWWRFAEGRLQQVNSRLDIDRLALSSLGEPISPITQIEGALGWRAGDRRWTVQGLGWQWQDQRVHGLDLQAWPLADDSGIELRAAGVPVAELAALVLSLNLLPAPAREALLNYQPAGVLDRARLRLQPVSAESGTASPFEFAARLKKVSVQAHGGAPGGEGIDGLIWLDRYGGWVDTDSHDVTLGFPELFLDSWQLDRVTGRVAWRLESDGTRVFAEGLEATYQGDTRIQGAFDLSLKRYGDDNLGLAIQIEDAPAGQVSRFVPARVVGSGLYDWLATAITGGRVESGQFFGHGQIGWGAPPGSFSTSMRFRFRDGEITYDPAWPEVTGADGEVLITDGETDIRLTDARTGGLELEPGRVQVLRDAAGTRVQVEAAAPVAGDQVGFWLANTPLGELAGAAGETVTLSGDYSVELGLSIPLDVGQQFDVWGSLTTDNGRVYYPLAELTWDQVRGRINWDSRRQVPGGEVSARFLGHPVRTGFQLDPVQGTLILNQRGELSLEQLNGHLLRLFDLPLLNAPGLAGVLPYQARLRLGANDNSGRNDLTVKASTARLISDWPAPLRQADPVAESAGEPLQLILGWGSEDGLTLDGHWGERLQLAVAWNDEGFTGADIALQESRPAQPAQPFPRASAGEVRAGVRLQGRFHRLDPMDWLGRLGPGPDAVASEQSRAVTLLSSARYNWLQRMDLDVGELVLGDLLLPDISLSATPEAGGWLLAVESERAKGRIRLPAGGDIAWVDLEQLRLNRPGEPGLGSPEDARAASAAGRLTPLEQLEAFRALATGTWPELDVRIESLFLGDEHAGAWSFVMRPEPDQVTIDGIQGRLGSLAGDGSLRWGVRSGEALTQLSLTFEGGALRDLSAFLGEELPLRNNGTVIGLDLQWPGRPDQMTLGELSGELSLRLDDGVILQGSNSAQLFRLFSLLNTDTLQRRLRFDFSDLYEAGVTFDAISGTASLDNGRLTWEPELQMAGPSVAFRVTGSTDLAQESLDMRLVAVLPLTQNLPLAAILIGASPPVGGALFVLDKLLGEPLSRLTSATYTVSGTWEDPDVRLSSIFDTGD